MGRKKIEIKPLTDERNRNVTFLKRKAGLMKKAYELSVLCGVSVSLLIFSGNGKPYEFSSGDFDAEIDRYNDYEGTIERRRGAEFEAMALAGEDDEDDDDDVKPGKAKLNAPPKSLKGKESFKARRVPWKAEPAPSGRDRRPSRRESTKPDTFIGGVLEEEDITPPPRPDSPSAAGLSYALGLHSQPSHSQHGQHQGGGAPWNAYRAPQYSNPLQNGPPFMSAPGFSGSSSGMPGSQPPWDNQMLTTYAWLQIQQAHQEQKRILLEKQQQQLLELTSRSGGAAFLRDILGPGLSGGGGGAAGMGGSNSAGAGPPPNSGGGGGSSSGWNDFVWPTAPLDQVPATQVETPPGDDDMIWALSGGAGAPGGPSNSNGSMSHGPLTSASMSSSVDSTPGMGNMNNSPGEMHPALQGPGPSQPRSHSRSYSGNQHASYLELLDAVNGKRHREPGMAMDRDAKRFHQ